MTRRCKHLNCIISQVAEEWMDIIFEDGKFIVASKYPGLILPPLFVRCKDCDREWRYTQHTAPKWVKRRILEGERDSLHKIGITELPIGLANALKSAGGDEE